MSDLYRKLYRLGDESQLFEIGHRSLDSGCQFVVNAERKTLERIYTVETGFDRDHTCRVETLPGKWYEIDGSTTFAKLIVGPDKSLNKSGLEPSHTSWEPAHVFAIAESSL